MVLVEVDTASSEEDRRDGRGRQAVSLLHTSGDSTVSRYAAGDSAKALSQEFDISRDGVRRLLKDAGVAIRPQKVVTLQAADQIVELYESGLTIRQVVEQVGYSFGTVQRVLNRHGGIMRVSPVGKRAAPENDHGVPR